MYSYDGGERVSFADAKNGKMYILLKSRLDYVFKSEDDYQIVEEFLGYELKGQKYEPIFPYYAHVRTYEIRNLRVACSVLCSVAVILLSRT